MIVGWVVVLVFFGGVTCLKKNWWPCILRGTWILLSSVHIMRSLYFNGALWAGRWSCPWCPQTWHVSKNDWLPCVKRGAWIPCPPCLRVGCGEVIFLFNETKGKTTNSNDRWEEAEREARVENAVSRLAR